MKKRFCFAAIALLFCTLQGYARETAGMPNTPNFSVNAEGAVVMEAMTGRILFEQDAHKRLPMASTTKIMTSLLALEQPEIDAVFEISADAIKVEGSSMGLVEGDKASLRALATGMLLASGNDAANSAAVRISGSIPAFAEKMNKRAKEIGMLDTSFHNPSGLDNESHYSTAYDMALLAREALRNDRFSEICREYRLRTSYGNPPYDRWLTNHNKLLNYYEGAVGVKTGFTKKSGRCLVSAARKDGILLICVTLNCPDDWRTHAALLNDGFSRLQVEDLSRAMPEIRIPVTGGTQPQVQAVQYERAQVPVPTSGAEIAYQVTIQPFLYAPVVSGQSVGDVAIYVDGQQVFNLTLQAAKDIPLLHPYDEKPALSERLRAWFDGFVRFVRREG